MSKFVPIKMLLMQSRKAYLKIIALLFSLFSLSAQGKTILVLGDSISAAFGIDPQAGWVTLLDEKLKDSRFQSYQVVNASVSGNTTGDGLGRLPALLEEHNPSIVIVQLGGNDGLRGYPVRLMKNNLQKIIDLSRASGAKVLLAGIEILPNYGQRYTRAFRETYQHIAKENKVVFLPFILKDVALNPSMMQWDRIHPRAEAQPVLLNNVWPYLKKLL